ncbi:MAG: hypothetical protein ACEPOV_01810 [Hyphomicrobiales bacterium]
MNYLYEKNNQASPSFPIKILQFGTNPISRSTISYAIDLLNKETNFRGSIIALQLNQTGNSAQLNAQNGEFHIVTPNYTKEKTTYNFDLITSINKAINPKIDFEELIKTLEQPELRFFISYQEKCELQFSEERYTDNHLQYSFSAIITAALYHRYQFFQGDPNKGIIYIPCEQEFRYGDKIKKHILQHIYSWDLETSFFEWIEKYCYFTNTLFDRTVKGFSETHSHKLYKDLHIHDNLLSVAEKFYLWIIECPEFVKGELPLELSSLNIKYVDKIDDFYHLKHLLLPGSINILAPIAILYNSNNVNDILNNKYLNLIFKHYTIKEIFPLIHLSNEFKERYITSIEERIRNKSIDKSWTEIIHNPSGSYKSSLIPSIWKYYHYHGKLPLVMTLSLTSYIYLCKDLFIDNDLNISEELENLYDFHSEWNLYKTNNDLYAFTKNILSWQHHWGENLNNIPGLTLTIEKQLKLLIEAGIDRNIKNLTHSFLYSD